MSDSMRELYQEIIIDHSRHPRNFGQPTEPASEAKGQNPLCGDKVTVYAVVKDGKVQEVKFEGTGCAICMASASLMTGAVTGKQLSEVLKTFDEVRTMLTAEGETELPEDLGDIVVLAGVRDYPIRVKCATLPWHALKAALTSGEVATTE